MIRIIQIGLLSLLFLLLSFQEGRAATQRKPVLKDGEFNDPMLEEEAQLEAEMEAMEKEALDARGGTPLEENVPPKPPPEEPQKDEEPLQAQPKNNENSEADTALTGSEGDGTPTDTEPTLNASDEKTESAQTPEIDSGEGDKLSQDLDAEALAEDDPADLERKELGLELAPESLSTSKSEKSPSKRGWNPRDPRKGFLSADEENGYYYKEDSGGMEREYPNDYKIVPRPENYKRGLLYVSGDGSYMYSGEDSELEGSASLRVSQMPALQYENSLGVTYEDIYGSKPISLVLFDYDLLSFRRFGHWVMSIGTAVGAASGQGLFVDDGTEALERYSLFMVLNHISFIYRFQYTPHQWIVPYISAGGVPAILYERRDDNKRNRYKLVPAAQASGGLRLNIGRFDSFGASNLDVEYGINNMWLDVEYRRIQSFSDKIDISNNLINLGLGFDF